MNTKKLLFVALMMMCAITVHALQLRESHFFKTFSDVQPMVKAAPALFDQWFALPTATVGAMTLNWRNRRKAISLAPTVLRHRSGCRTIGENGIARARTRRCSVCWKLLPGAI